jgi:hypothetical protein
MNTIRYNHTTIAFFIYENYPNFSQKLINIIREDPRRNEPIIIRTGPFYNYQKYVVRICLKTIYLLVNKAHTNWNEDELSGTLAKEELLDQFLKCNLIDVLITISIMLSSPGMYSCSYEKNINLCCAIIKATTEGVIYPELYYSQPDQNIVNQCLYPLLEYYLNDPIKFTRENGVLISFGTLVWTISSFIYDCDELQHWMILQRCLTPISQYLHEWIVQWNPLQDLQKVWSVFEIYSDLLVGMYSCIEYLVCIDDIEGVTYDEEINYDNDQLFEYKTITRNGLKDYMNPHKMIDYLIDNYNQLFVDILYFFSKWFELDTVHHCPNEIKDEYMKIGQIQLSILSKVVRYADQKPCETLMNMIFTGNEYVGVPSHNMLQFLQSTTCLKKDILNLLYYLCKKNETLCIDIVVNKILWLSEVIQYAEVNYTFKEKRKLLFVLEEIVEMSNSGQIYKLCTYGRVLGFVCEFLKLDDTECIFISLSLLSDILDGLKIHESEYPESREVSENYIEANKSFQDWLDLDVWNIIENIQLETFNPYIATIATTIIENYAPDIHNRDGNVKIDWMDNEDIWNEPVYFQEEKKFDF